MAPQRACTPVGLPQQISNTCFLNAACQVFRIPCYIAMNNSKFNELIFLYTKMIESGEKTSIELFLKAIRSSDNFDIDFGKMDDSFSFLMGLADECCKSDDVSEENFIIQYVRDSKICSSCKFERLPEKSQSTEITITHDIPVSHGIVAALTKSSSCFRCFSQSTSSIVKCPKILMVKVPKTKPKGVNNIKVEKIISLDSVEYRLLGIIISSGIHATAICYYPNDLNNLVQNQGKWFHCNDSRIDEIHNDENESFISVSHYILGIVYGRITDNDEISNKELDRICSDNGIPWKFSYLELSNLTYSNPKPIISSRKNKMVPQNSITYSRQAFLTQQSRNSIDVYHVLICGLTGTSFEVAKNLVSMGFQNISIIPNLSKIEKFRFTCAWAREMDGNYFEAMKKFLLEINSKCEIRLFTKDITPTSLFEQKVSCIVAVDEYIPKLVQLNEIARKANVKFIAGDQKGLMVTSFVDYGNNFTYKDATGIPDVDERQYYIKSISIVEKQNNNPEKIDKECTIVEITSYDPISNKKQLKFFDPIAKQNIICNVIKTNAQTNTVQLEIPTINAANLLKICNQSDNSSITIVLTNIIEEKTNDFASLKSFIEEKQLPFVNSANRFDFFIYQLYKSFGDNDLKLNENTFDEWFSEALSKFKTVRNCPDKLAEQWKILLSRIFLGIDCDIILPPITTILGGLLAHDVFVAASHSFPPLLQWRSVCFSDILDQFNNDGIQILKERKIQNIIESLKVIQVGCGATGCETAKLFCEMKVGSNEKGHITFIDGDQFSRSNRNRQFLCTESQQFKPKSQVVPNELLKLFPTYSKDSFSSLQYYLDDSIPNSVDLIKANDLICGTVDNKKARIHACELAHLYNKFFIECGTASLAFSGSIYTPAINNMPPTAIYSNNSPSNNNLSFNCNPVTYSLRDSHTIQAGRILFDDWFHSNILTTKEALLSNGGESNLKKIKQYLNCFSLIKKNGDSVNPIQSLIIYLFNEAFVEGINAIIEEKNNSPENTKCSMPHTVEFDANNELHKKTLSLCLKLFSEIFNSYNNEDILESIEFDKDNPEHLEIVSCFAEIRCNAFDIKQRDFSSWRVQRIAGHSIPSIITSTAISAGLNCLNIYRIALLKVNLNPSRKQFCGSLLNSFVIVDSDEGNDVESINIFDNSTLKDLTDALNKKIPEGELDESRLIILISSGGMVQELSFPFPDKIQNMPVTRFMGGSPLSRIKLFPLYEEEIYDVIRVNVEKSIVPITQKPKIPEVRQENSSASIVSSNASLFSQIARNRTKVFFYSMSFAIMFGCWLWWKKRKT